MTSQGMGPSRQAKVRPVASSADRRVGLTLFMLRHMRARASGRETGGEAGISRIAAVALGLLLGVGNVLAADGLVLRAGGFVKGRAEISDDQIRCEVPT